MAKLKAQSAILKKRGMHTGDSYIEETLYVDGSNALDLSQQGERPAVSVRTHSNRERALQMNVGYVAFLAIAAVITVFACVQYLRLQSRLTALQEEKTALTSTLNEMKLDNDADYSNIMSSVDLESVKNIAINKLGMVYASADQIVTYDETENEYVEQYENIP